MLHAEVLIRRLVECHETVELWQGRTALGSELRLIADHTGEDCFDLVLVDADRMLLIDTFRDFHRLVARAEELRRELGVEIAPEVE